MTLTCMASSAMPPHETPVEKATLTTPTPNQGATDLLHIGSLKDSSEALRPGLTTTVLSLVSCQLLLITSL